MLEKGIKNRQENELESLTPNKCKDKIIIAHDNKAKAFFDIFILLIVGYSCVSTMLMIAFD